MGWPGAGAEPQKSALCLGMALSGCLSFGYMSQDSFGAAHVGCLVAMGDPLPPQLRVGRRSSEAAL